MTILGEMLNESQIKDGKDALENLFKCEDDLTDMIAVQAQAKLQRN